MILVVDNYDSFTYNLVQYIGELYPKVNVVRNDEVEIDDIARMNNIDGIVISPGPGRPEDAGICVDIVKEYAKFVPILGICLGHQTVAKAFGGHVIHAKDIKHGKISAVNHTEDNIFKNVRNPIDVMRYHSLVVEKNSIKSQFYEIAESTDGVVMGIKHKKYPVYGLQFHPESILTQCGRDIIKNFLKEICHVS